MANYAAIETHEIENVYNVPLEDGEVICPKCNGYAYEEQLLDSYRQKAYSSCDRCWGDGKLDWIELAMGKERPCAMSGMSSSSSRSSSNSITTTRHTSNVLPMPIMKRRSVNGINSKPKLRTIQRLLEMLDKSQGSLQRRGYKIRRRETKKQRSNKCIRNGSYSFADRCDYSNHRLKKKA